MLQPLSPQPNTPLLKQVARFAERRQDVLAGNIANIDTPGYRMRDLPTSEFRQALARAVAQSGAWSTEAHGLQPVGFPGATSPSLDDLFPAELFQARTPSEQPGITFQDGNNRSIEHQFLEMTKNSLWQHFALELLRGQYDQLQAVIAERP
jgi:flagellar basal-body rod protein FlgB